MKKSDIRLMATALSVVMIFSPNKINNKEYKALPPEPVKIEEPVKRLLPKKK